MDAIGGDAHNPSSYRNVHIVIGCDRCAWDLGLQ